MNAAVNELLQIYFVLKDFNLNEGDYPETLAKVGMAREDPWGRPYA